MRSFCGGVEGLRPDIVIVKGYCDKLDEATRHESKLVVLECKDRDFEYWRSELSTQVLEYARYIGPVVIASLKSVPEDIIEKWRKRGVVIVPNVRPGNEGGIRQLCEKIIKAVRAC
ncbi:MAG: hypothetical protein DRJ40_06540 [Thermoprotei archaeon]|nr:MAG: hypothetical protein DRJ40_06540 [Thermoprotei archaeon]